MVSTTGESPVVSTLDQTSSSRSGQRPSFSKTIPRVKRETFGEEKLFAISDSPTTAFHYQMVHMFRFLQPKAAAAWRNSTAALVLLFYVVVFAATGAFGETKEQCKEQPTCESHDDFKPTEIPRVDSGVTSCDGQGFFGDNRSSTVAFSSNSGINGDDPMIFGPTYSSLNQRTGIRAPRKQRNGCDRLSRRYIMWYV